jgi:hypothetical protein
MSHLKRHKLNGKFSMPLQKLIQASPSDSEVEIGVQTTDTGDMLDV